MMMQFSTNINKNIANVVKSVSEMVTPEMLDNMVTQDWFFAKIELYNRNEVPVSVNGIKPKPEVYLLIDTTRPMIYDNWNQYSVTASTLVQRILSINKWYEC